MVVSLFGKETLHQLASIGLPAVELDAGIGAGSEGGWAEELGMKLPLEIEELAHKVEIW